MKKNEYIEISSAARKLVRDQGLLKLERYNYADHGILNAHTEFSLLPYVRHAHEVYYGLELEVEAPIGHDKSKLQNALEIGLKDSHYCSYDGSLQNGVEIVTAPASALEHRGRYCQYFKMLQALQRLGCTSHNNERCGLHIHISRTALTEDQWYQLERWLIRYKTEWKRLSRRNDYQYCGFQHSLDSNSRYSALNLTCTRTKTAEIRFWRGTLAPGSFLASLELTMLLIEWAQKSFLTHFALGGFDTFAAYASIKSKIADKYLRSKGFIPSAEAIPERDSETLLPEPRRPYIRPGERQRWSQLLRELIARRYGNGTVVTRVQLRGRFPAWVREQANELIGARPMPENTSTLVITRRCGWGNPSSYHLSMR